MLPSEADLQLLFARLNNEHFQGAAPDCVISYNERFSNSAGRITYGPRPLLIEISPRHLRKYPESVSYTHLDVYKRQRHRPFPRRPFGKAERRSMKFREPIERLIRDPKEFTRDVPCLLYTSRCV